MKPTITLLCASALITSLAFAQAHEEGERRPGGPEGQGGPRGGPGGMMARLPVFKALDKDADGALSSEEIAGATVSLLTLDKDGDGKLSAEEIRPVMQPRGETPAQTAHRTFEALDKNTDGKITADELPERMKPMLALADADKDGSVTEEELTKHIEKTTPPPAPPAPRPEGEAPPKPGV